MIEKQSQIPELYDLKHKHDTDLHSGYDYENNLFYNLFSNVMFGNERFTTFINLLQKNTVWMIDSTLPIRNFYNYTVGRFYNKHNN